MNPKSLSLQDLNRLSRAFAFLPLTRKPPMESEIHQNKTFERIIYAEKVVKNREFEQCTFKSCDFSKSDFSYSRFSDSAFIDCNLALMKLNQATLDNIVFKDCKLIGMNFSDCSDFLFSARFENCLLDFASFSNKKMGKTVFKDSSLKSAEFTNAFLSKALFENTNLSGAVFNRTNLQEANFVTAYNYSIDPELNNIKRATFSQHGLAGLLAKYGIRVA